MKVTYTEQIESRTALSRKMYCGQCGEHGYEIVEQLAPATSTPWTVRCPYCGYETPKFNQRKTAIDVWKRLYGHNYIC